MKTCLQTERNRRFGYGRAGGGRVRRGAEAVVLTRRICHGPEPSCCRADHSSPARVDFSALIALDGN